MAKTEMKLTKEEILDNKVYDIDDHGNKLITYESAISAMQEYAEQYHKEKMRELHDGKNNNE